MASNIPDRNASTTSWHVGLTPIFPSSLLLSDNAAVASLLSDIPFLAVGLLAFAVLTFLLIMRRFAAKSIPLFLSAILAFVAVVLDIDQLLVQNSASTGNTSKSNNGLTVPLSSILPLLIAREVFLGIAIGMRFLYFWAYFYSISLHIGTISRDRKDNVPTRTTSNVGELSFLKLQGPSPDPFQTSFNGLTSGHTPSITVSLPSIFVLAFKYAALTVIASIPILQLLWRLTKEFNRHGGLYIANSIIEIVTSIVVITALLMGVLVDIVKMGSRFSLSWKKVGKWEKLKSFIPLLFSASVELGSSIGSLVCFEFSESSLGRLLQALELYILILNILISTFYKKGQTGRFFSRSSDTEKGDKDQDANLIEKAPASGQNVSTRADAPAGFLRTSVSPQESPRYRSAGSWPLSILTNRDNDTDGNSNMLSIPGSSILSPSIRSKRLSLWFSGKRRSERSLRPMSGLLGGGRIRSMSWEVLNDSMENGGLEKDSKSADIANVGTPSVSNQSPPNQRQSESEDSLQSRHPFARIRVPPLAGRLERLATQLDSFFSVQEGKERPVSSAIPASSADRTSKSSVRLAFQAHPMVDSNEFHLTPIMPSAPNLPRSSYYEVGPGSASYSPRLSYSHDKSNYSSISNSTAEIESYIREQQAGLEKSIAELRLLEGERPGGLDVGNRRNSIISDFSFNEFPDLPKSVDQPPNTLGNERLTSRISFGGLPPADRIPPSFSSPAIRTSADSSVLGVNEAILTLGLGSDPGVTTREESSPRQLDVTSFIAAGGGVTDSFPPPSRPAAISISSPPSLSGTEDAEGVDTPPPSTVRFATKVHIPPVTSVPATISRSLSGSKSVNASSTADESSARPIAVTTEPHAFSNTNETHILSNRPLRRKIGIGLPSSVKLSADNPNPFPGPTGARDD